VMEWEKGKWEGIVRWTRSRGRWREGGGFDLRPERRRRKIEIWKGFEETEESSNN
jgi:hypothetical protein